MISSTDYKIRIGLISSPSGLSLSIVEKILTRGNSVVLITNQKDKWNNYLGQLADNKSFNIQDSINKDEVDYLIYVSGYVEPPSGQTIEALEKKDREEIGNINKILTEKYIRTLIVYPYISDKKIIKSINSNLNLVKKNEAIGFYLVGDLAGPGLVLSPNSIVSKTIKDVVEGREVYVSKKENEIYLTSISQAAEIIARSLMSFGPYSNERILITGKKISVSKLLENVYKLHPNTVFSYSSKVWSRQKLKVNKRLLIETSIEQVLSDTFKWHSAKTKEKKIEQDKQTSEVFGSGIVATQEHVFSGKVLLPDDEISQNLAKINYNSGTNVVDTKVKKHRWVLPLVGIIFLLLLPILSLFLSTGMFYVSAKSIKLGSYKTTQNILFITKQLTSITNKEWNVISLIPLESDLIESGYQLSLLLDMSTNTAHNLSVIAPLIIKNTKNVVSDEGSISNEEIKDIAVELGSAYKDLGFIESEINSSNSLVKKYVNKVINGEELESLRQYTFLGSTVFAEFNDLVGVDGERKYLILFQNNMELRPTGGFIGSIGLVHLIDGGLVDIDILDVYSVDGNLKGYVEPPRPIEKYLDEATWSLRDSNWDTSFTLSAQKAEWFLDKSMDVKVDGVIAVDLGFVEKLMEEIGPLEIADFDQTVNAGNLYSIIQKEVEEDFFPGSRKKANFLTALSRDMINKLLNTEEGGYVEIVKSVVSSFDEKHVLVYFHNEPIQALVSNVGWSGGTIKDDCYGNCYSDWVGVVDANLGVNKANYYVDKSMDFSVEVDSESIRRKMDVTLMNKAGLASGKEAVYKSYIRLLTEDGSVVGNVTVSGKESKDILKPDITLVDGHKEAGVYVEVKPGETKKLVFLWEGDSDLEFDETGKYKLLWRKQPGTYSDNVSVTVVVNENVLPYSVPKSDLTQKGVLRYNTELLTDFESVIFW